jgi:hypothetical protein
MCCLRTWLYLRWPATIQRRQASLVGGICLCYANLKGWPIFFFGGRVQLLSESCSDNNERKLDPVQLKSLSFSFFFFFTGRRPIMLTELRSRACYTGKCKELYCMVRDSTPGNKTIKYRVPLQT